MSKIKTDNWVCNWCGSEEVYKKVFINMNTNKQAYLPWTPNYGGCNEGESEYTSDCCDDFEYPMTQFDWQEKVAEATMGNKEEYHKILDGSRL